MIDRSASKTPGQKKRVVKPGVVGRQPSQARGQARTEAILKSAAKLIAEEGLAGVTMHTLARHAKTSIGSLYHFFPDREAVLEALRQQHVAAMRAINEQLSRVPGTEWRMLSLTAVTERLVAPFVAYLRSHPDYLPLTMGRMSEEARADFMRVIQLVLKARWPKLSSKASGDYVLMFHLIASGVMHVGIQLEPDRVELYLREIPRALTAYLETIETSAKTVPARARRRKDVDLAVEDETDVLR